MDNSLNHKKALEILKNSGVIIFPTDTAFGIGCRVDDEEAVKKVFNIRNRPVTQATPVLCSSISMVEEYVLEISDSVQRLMDSYWPGALTIILSARIEKVPSLVRGGGLTVGVRIPRHADTLNLISDLGVPVIGPSANFHGGNTPFEMDDIDPKLSNLVDYVLPGECSVKKESTVIDCSEPKWRIIRQGAVRINHELIYNK